MPAWTPFARLLRHAATWAGAAAGTVALAALGASRPAPEGPPRFTGDLTPASVDAFIHRLDGLRPAPAWMAIDSRGGDVDAALRLAQVIHARGLSLVVTGLCASSCANYLFPAARQKVIAAGASVGWHGSPASEHIDGLEQMTADQLAAFHTMQQALVLREQQLYATLGVDPRMLCAGDRTIERAGALGWTMPLRAMARFGVRDVVAVDHQPIPTHVRGRAAPVLVIDPQPDCQREYPPLPHAGWHD